MPQTGAAAALIQGSPAAEAAAGEATKQIGGIKAKGAGSAAVLTIEHIESTVKVLNTKTRPKRLQFLGSDGHTYGFLLKVSPPSQNNIDVP